MTALQTFAELGKAFLRYARLHKDVVDRFGRFPHRNAILGREVRDGVRRRTRPLADSHATREQTTPDEARHLEEKGGF